MTADDETLLAVCRTTYRRVMQATCGEFWMVQLAVVQDLDRAGFDVDRELLDAVERMKTCVAALEDGRAVFRDHAGNFEIDRDYA